MADGNSSACHIHIKCVVLNRKVEKKTGALKPGVFRGIRPQNLHRYQQRASFPHIERELEIREVLRVFYLAQMDLRTHADILLLSYFRFCDKSMYYFCAALI